MTSQLRDVPLKSQTEVLELKADVGDIEDGLKATLSAEAEEALQEVCTTTIDEIVAKFEEKVKREAAEKLKKS